MEGEVEGVGGREGSRGEVTGFTFTAGRFVWGGFLLGLASVGEEKLPVITLISPIGCLGVCDFSQFLVYLNKEYILISRGDHIHQGSAIVQCPSGITDAHSQNKEKELQKRKVPLE
jgi:hypothetical protein